MKRLLLIAALAGCSETRVIDLSFGGRARTGAPIGFDCRDDTGVPIITRAVDPGRVLAFSLLVEYVRLDGLPSCRASDVIAFCVAEDDNCVPLAQPERACIPLRRELRLGESPVVAVGELLRGVDGMLVTSGAPHGPVIVRAIATAQPCEELGGISALDPEQLVGCAMSCPVQLESVEGEVLLDLPTLSDRCAEAVTICAALNVP